MCARLHLPLYTPRLLLRDFILADFQAIHAYASDPEVTEFMFYGPRDEADVLNRRNPVKFNTLALLCGPECSLN